MKQKQMDQEIEMRIKNCMMNQIPESEQVNNQMNEAYQKIRQSKAAKKSRLPIAMKCTTAAAMLFLAMVYCVKNPAVAAQLPLIGNIFSGLEDQVSYPGDYSKNAIKLPAQADAVTDTDKDTQVDTAADTDINTQAEANKETDKDVREDEQDSDEVSYQVTSKGIKIGRASCRERV